MNFFKEFKKARKIGGVYNSASVKYLHNGKTKNRIPNKNKSNVMRSNNIGNGRPPLL